MRPNVGRIVHYVSHGPPDSEFPGTCRAAIVTEVNTDGQAALAAFARHRDDSEIDPEMCAGLAVISLDSLLFRQAVPYHASHEPGSWHWPERVEEESG